MTLKQAEAALGAKLQVDYPEDERCGGAWRPDQPDSGISYMVMSGKITRIDIFHSNIESGSPVVTAAGVGVGDTEAAVRRAYGAALVVEPHHYDDDGHYLRIDEVKAKRGIIFETSHGVVTSFRAGRYPSLGYVEGCL